MTKKRKLVIIGDSSFAEVSFEYFTHYSEYEVVAFSVENAFLKKTSVCGLSIVPFEEIERFYAPESHYFFASVVYTQLNRLRSRLYHEAKKKGYSAASFISTDARISPSAEIGEHCFIFESNVIQPFVKIGTNVVLWSGNHIGHHSTVGDNCFISSHVVISGHCKVGENCFFGVNSALADRVSIGRDCVVGAGAIVLKDTEEAKVYQGNPAQPWKASSLRVFKVPQVHRTDALE